MSSSYENSGTGVGLGQRPTMLVLLMCCMMKMLELSGPRGRPPPKQKTRRRFRRRSHVREGKVMNEAECVGVGVGSGTMGDCNSNPAPGAANTSSTTASCLSNASSQDIGDFVQDNSDYQWFLDYGYRDGVVHHASVLSSLTESYRGEEEVGYYEALSKNLDANLAEADMESFRTEDIHALLTTLPAMCTDMQLVSDANREGEMFASVTTSLRSKFDFSSPHSSSQGEESAASPDTMSICKSELLFSPVKETPMPGAHFSVDSLDCDLEHDIMLTCQANKDNYTIAFEGSVTMYSEESEDYHYTDKSEASNSDHRWTCSMNKRHQKIIDSSMARSDSGLTTWSKLKKRSSENQLRRHPSGNNNNSSTDETTSFQTLSNDNTLKSQSMPNLHKQKLKPVSRPQYLAKVFDIQHQSRSSCYSDMVMSIDGASSNTEKPKSQPHNFSLVRLFMKQKSISAEGMSCGMDQSSTSECWPASQSESGDSFDLKNRRLTRSTEKTKSAPECSMFLDSLVDPKNRINLIREEIEDNVSERSESVEQLSESASVFNSYERSSPQCYQHSSNNNNSSVEQEDLTCSLKRKNRKGGQTKRYNASSHENSACSEASSSTESTECNRLHNKPNPVIVSTKINSTKSHVPLMNRSIQTSRLGDLNYKLTRSSYAPDWVRIVEPSFLQKLKQQSEYPKPVYVVYPNYTLPDLEFLKEKREDVTKVILVPQKYSSDEEKPKKPPVPTARNRRPFSCNDIEMLKKRGFSHVRDWDSLTFLLPVECRQILADVPEIKNVVKTNEELLKHKEPLFCVSPPVRHKPRPLSCDCSSLDRNNISSSSSTATQPSSGYRGSSTMLSDSQNSPAPNTFNPLFVYRYDSVTSSETSINSDKRSICTTAPSVPKRSISLTDSKTNLKKLEKIPPRPPLPKGILRKSMENCKTKKNIANTKRYSMFEMGENEIEDDFEETCFTNKRKSLHEPYYLSRRTFSEHSTETEDEGVEAGHGTDSSVEDRFENLCVRPPTPPLPKTEIFNCGAISVDELEQLEEYLKISGVSYSDADEWDENELLRLRSHVSKFLTLKINKNPYDPNFGKKSVSFAERVAVDDQKLYTTPPNSPNVSAMMHRHYQGKTLVDMPICEEGELSPDGFHSPKMETVQLSEKSSPTDMSQKLGLISAITHSVEYLIHHFSAANSTPELTTLGDSELNPSCARLVLSSLCPALYALLSDGLKPTLDTPFGAINNSVWQVVEASAQQGPLTKALNELVMRINGEDVISEGMVKFNAFVFGLLNVRSLDAWASYLRTRETILRKHYTTDSLLIQATTGGASMRSLLDSLIATLQPLALLPFQIDLLFEYRQLHNSLKRMDEYTQPISPTHLKISPLTNLTNKQLTLMKLVRSVQSNISQSQSCDETDDISIATMIHRHSHDSSTSDPSLPDLLNSSAHTKTQIRDEKYRPRSCVDPNLGAGGQSGFKLEDLTVKKRWSGIHLGSKFGQAFERFSDDTEEEYTDSLEHNAANRNNRVVCNEEERHSNGEGSTSPPSIHEDEPTSLDSHISDSAPLNGGKFRRLQLKWEMLSGRDSTLQSPPLSPTHSNAKSKIPRLVNSPVKSGIPVLSPSFGKGKIGVGAQATGKKVITPPGNQKKVVGVVGKGVNAGKSLKKPNVVTRTSRVDQLENSESRIHPVRPSSLPYRPVSSAQGTKGSKMIPPRRAVSSSVNRKPTQQNKTPKVVRTLTHRLPSDNGHLSFNEGDKLKVILEVDSKWLLCCRGDQKGLVPRSAVIAIDGRN